MKEKRDYRGKIFALLLALLLAAALPALAAKSPFAGDYRGDVPGSSESIPEEEKEPKGDGPALAGLLFVFVPVDGDAVFL